MTLESFCEGVNLKRNTSMKRGDKKKNVHATTSSLQWHNNVRDGV